MSRIYVSLVMFVSAVPYAKRVFFRFTRLGAIFVLASASHLIEVIVLSGYDDVDLLRVLVKEVLWVRYTSIGRQSPFHFCANPSAKGVSNYPTYSQRLG